MGATGSTPTHLQKAFVTSILAFIAVVLPLYCIFVRYADMERSAYHAHVSQYYTWFLDINVMVLIGFGFLMAFLRRYSYGAIGLNYFLSGLVIVEAILVVGAFQQVVWGSHSKVHVELPLLIDASICAASAMIWFGAVIGKATPSQLVWLAVLFVPLYAVNQHLVFHTLGALDVGGSISVHAFGAYYGLAASLLISRKQTNPGGGNPLNACSYTSNVFGMIGTIFLWLYWPSFNAALASVAAENGEIDPDAVSHRNQFYIIVNTFTSLLGSIISTFAASVLVDGKFNMVHVANATLAGGVMMGSAANLYITPGGALGLGMAAGAISTLCFAYLSPLLERKTGLTDTCGVHNLHGIPGCLGGLAAGFASWGQHSSLLAHGDAQLGWQLLAVVVTLAIAITGGLLGGLIVTACNRWPISDADKLYNDDCFWLDAEELGAICEPQPTCKGSTVKPAGFQVPANESPSGRHSRTTGQQDEDLYRDSSYHGNVDAVIELNNSQAASSSDTV